MYSKSWLSLISMQNFYFIFFYLYRVRREMQGINIKDMYF